MDSLVNNTVRYLYVVVTRYHFSWGFTVNFYGRPIRKYVFRGDLLCTAYQSWNLETSISIPKGFGLSRNYL